MQRDSFECKNCHDTNSTLHVHHRWYTTGCEPWSYPDECLVTLCESCHEAEEESKVQQQILIQTFLAAGFLNVHMGFISSTLEKCFKHINNIEFDMLLSRFASSSHFRSDVRAAYQKDCERIDKIRESETPDMPF
jgi:hypothetical protein